MNKRTMIFGLLALAVLSVATVAVAAEKAGGIHWYSYEDGLAKAKETGRPVVIDFHAVWCKWCRKLDQDTFNDARVIAQMNDLFIPISIDTDKEKEHAAKYDVQSLPTMWFLDSNGDPIDTLPGFVEADFFTIVLDYVASGSYKSIGFQEYVDSRS